MKPDAQPQSALRSKEHEDPADRKGMLRGRLLSPELLRAFVAVVECNGYTAAAQYLHRTQAAISQQIARLEDCTGIDLFEKPTRQLKLTEQGRVLLDYARRLLALNNETMDKLRPGVVSGSVRMGATNLYATTVLPSLLAEFSDLYPAIHIDLQVGVAEEMQRKLGPAFDLTINAFQGGEGNGVLLRKDPVVWAVSKKSSPQHKRPVPLALLPQGSLLRRWAEEALTASGERWVVVQESSSVEVLKASVVAGLAVGVFQEATISPVADMRILTPEDGFPKLPSSEMWLERANRELPRAAKCLYEFLLEQLPPWAAE
ncbi:LysR substrate-binding domain-containing protein [Variovorax paradoxus]|uniref:LysR substrate-binding domain-containing protein n=1 Tax=Variovorax paradoxus TaxID=34073 RepID=UPI00278205B6|nr:LysR substrate-binding domain-containing protein [Variovorax paradoxus]MDQ0587881.1 DNA-binding transcriptional LysR family regulator [Variovorax paradoxus]